MSNVNNLVLPVVNFAGEKVGEVTLPGYVYNYEVNEYAVQRAVRVDLSNRRVSTAHTLDRSVVHGSNKKPYGQKHTGRARAGTTNSPLWRHGGVVHGPNGEQSYKLKMNKTEAYIAYISALSDKAQNNNIIVLDGSEFHTAKTKDFVKTLKAIGADEKKNLLVLWPKFSDECEMSYDENLVLAARNAKNVKLVYPDNLSVYDILNANKLILVKGFIEADQEFMEEAE